MKKRLYTLNQSALDTVKEELQKQGVKANNQTAANYSVCWLAEEISRINKTKNND